MSRRAEGKTGDPIAAPNGSVRFQMQKIDVFADGEMIDTAALFHD